jgi:DNA modification methylase
MIKLFLLLEKVVKTKGVVLFNMSYSSKDASLPYRLLTKIQKKTKWVNRETLYWKKPVAIPFQTSPQNMSRIVEPIFVFSMNEKFITNKPVTKINERTGQKFYGYADNFIEATGYDKGTRKIHKATFSCDLVEQLINLYFPVNSIILDPFCGVGTTGVACSKNDRRYILIDIDPSYTEYSSNRLQ